MADIQVYEVTHSSPEIKTVGAYVSDINSPAYQYADDPEGFLKVTGTDGKTNKERIIAKYITPEEKKYKNKPAREMLLKTGTKLAIPVDKIERSALATEGIEVVSNDVPAFKAQSLVDIEAEPTYTQVSRPIKGKLQSGTLKEMYPDMSVWIWCRSLSRTDDNEMQGEIFDLTPFILKATTNVGKNGGNFSIQLPPLVCELKTDEAMNTRWVIKRKSLQTYVNKKGTSVNAEGYVAEASLYKGVMYTSDFNKQSGEVATSEYLIRNQFLFHNIIGTNDVIFIRFETLRMEAADRMSDGKNFYVNRANLAGKIYDMIGLIDNNTIGVNPDKTDVTINIAGRDLSKLWIEDGTYFYALEATKGQVKYAGGATQNSSLMQRVFTNNAALYLNLYNQTSIEHVLKFVIQQLSTIKVTPNNLFDSYGDRRNTRYNELKKDPRTQQLEDYEKKVKDLIRGIRKKNELSLKNKIQEDKQIDTAFKELKRFLIAIRDNNVRILLNGKTNAWNPFKYTNPRGVTEKVEQDTFPEFFNSMLFNLRETRVVSEIWDAVNNIDAIIDLERSIKKNKAPFKEDLANGIWQINKLVIDEGVTARRIADSSISLANGSLLNFVRKICQEPFVEFRMDTYGDMFYMVIRKPPIDKIGVQSMLKGNVVSENGQTIKRPAVIDILAEDVLKEDLFFDDTEVYSWYHITPQANFLGTAGEYSLAYLPALYFDEYSDIWGSRPMDITHNYMAFLNLDKNKKSSDQLDKAERQAAEDLRFLVESHAYLPFTRKGALKINGDRRIKAGNFIRYKPTNEIFMVDSVQQDFTISEGGIDRTTMIQVSRGMVEQFIYGVDLSGIKNTISYFNIINTNLRFEYEDQWTTEIERVKVGRKFYPYPGAQNEGLTTKSDPGITWKFEDKALKETGNINTQLLDKYTDINDKQVFIALINAINSKGFRVFITSTKRSYTEQAALYKANNKNAHPGHSHHETGKAIDINIIDDRTAKHYKKDTLKSEWEATGIPQLARSMGLKWGGSDFTNYYDPVHFELLETGSNNTNSTQGEYEDIFEEREKKVLRKGLARDKIFSNFKVNKDVFNFFLRHEQFNFKEFVRTQEQDKQQDLNIN